MSNILPKYMATIVNNPQPIQRSSGMGTLIAVLLVIFALLLLFYYGLPVIRSIQSAPQVSVPSHIDVNVHTQ